MKERSLGRQLAYFSLPAVVMLGLLSSACSGAAPEKYSEPPDAPNAKPTPDLLIPSATTAEAPPSATTTPQSTEIPKPVATPAFSVPESVIVFGTGSCLNMREQPTTSGKVIACVKDNTEQFIITGGPVTADGYLWWQLNRETRWAAQDYLQKWTRQPSGLGTGNSSELSSNSLEQQAQQAALKIWKSDLNRTNGTPEVRTTGRVILGYEYSRDYVKTNLVEDKNQQMIIYWAVEDSLEGILYGNMDYGKIYRGAAKGKSQISQISTTPESQSLTAVDKQNGVVWHGLVTINYATCYKLFAKNRINIGDIPDNIYQQFDACSPVDWLNESTKIPVALAGGSWREDPSSSSNYNSWLPLTVISSLSNMASATFPCQNGCFVSSPMR